jgi:hypothetical protein
MQLALPVLARMLLMFLANATSGDNMKNSYFSTIAVLGTFAFGAGCGTSGSNTSTSNRTDAMMGTGGSGGSAVGAGCTASNTKLAPADGLIADFNGSGGGPDAGGIEIMGGIIAFGGGAVGGTGAPIFTTTGGTLNITESAAATSAPQYVGVVIYFNNCIDASAFTGVQFTISGSFSGCTMQYSTDDSEHGDSTLSTPNPHATGPAGSYSMQARLAATQVTSTPMTISIPFTGPGAPAGGSPDGVALDTAKLDSLTWQLTIPVASAVDGTPTCAASLAIDNVGFYH